MTGDVVQPLLGDIAVVDAHCHVWEERYQRQSWPDAPPALARSFTAADLQRSCEGSGVASTVLIEAGTTDGEAAFLEESAAAPFVGAFIAYIDPLSGDVGPLLDRLMRRPSFRGVRLRFEGRPAADLEVPRVVAAVREIAARGLVLDLLVTTEHLPAVVRLADAVPDLHAIIDHMAKPDMHMASDADHWHGLVSRIGTETSLLFKMSLSPRAADIAWMAKNPAERWQPDEVRPYLQALLEAVGPRRMAWGSDWPVGVFGGDHASALRTIMAALGALDHAVAEQLFRSTASSFYGLD
jgi:L-fuconolactonase